MKQISSLDLHFLVKELKELEGSRADRIYSSGKEEIYIQLHKSSVGKKIIRVLIGKSIFAAEAKSIDETPSGFCMFLRKHLEGKFFDSIEQLEPERILKLTFKSKEESKFLYLEFFGKGNLILCNQDGIILDSLIHHQFKDRNVAPKEKYLYPIMAYNFFDINEKKLSELLNNSKKDKLVTSLAVELGLGGIYSEEICMLLEIDKNIKPADFPQQKIKKFLAIIKKLIKSKVKAQIVYKDKQALDVTPIELGSHKNYEKKEFSSFSLALEHYFTNEVQLVKKESPYTKKINELMRIMGEQGTAIKEMQTKEEEIRKNGEAIYNNYGLIKEILIELNKAKGKYSWEEIKEKLKGHKIVKEVNAKERKIIVEFD